LSPLWTEPTESDVEEIKELGALYKEGQLIGPVDIKLRTQLRRTLDKDFNRALKKSNKQRKDDVIKELKKAGIPSHSIRVKEDEFDASDWDVEIKAKVRVEPKFKKQDEDK